MVGLLTENEGDCPALPTAQHREAVSQPLHERGILEAVVAVVGVAVNWLGVHILHVLQGHGDGHDVHLPVIWDRMEGQDVHLPVIRDGIEGQDMHLPVGRDRDEGLDVHLSIAWGRHGRNAFDGDQFSVMGVMVMLDGRTRFDLVETEQLPETIGDSYCGVAHRVAWATTGLDGRNDLDAIQPILAANGSGGRAVEKLAGRAYFITGGY